MTQIKKGVSFSMGRFPQFVGQAAVTASVLVAGASLLNAGVAQAVACSGKNGSNFDYSLVNPPPSQGGFPPPVGSCISPVAANPLTVNVDHDYPDNSQPFNTSGSISYTLTSFQGPFVNVNIDADLDATGSYLFTFTKEIFNNAAFAGIPAIHTFVNNSGTITITPSGTQPLVGYGSQIWVRDSWSISGQGEVDNITNTFQTPGPLSILGTGAAFGFSRKLRGRIKAARLSD